LAAASITCLLHRAARDWEADGGRYGTRRPDRERFRDKSISKK